MPMLIIPLALLYGLKGIDLLIVYCFFATPSALINSLFVKQVNGNVHLSNNMILATTMCFAVACPLWLVILDNF